MGSSLPQGQADFCWQGPLPTGKEKLGYPPSPIRGSALGRGQVCRRSAAPAVSPCGSNSVLLAFSTYPPSPYCVPGPAPGTSEAAANRQGKSLFSVQGGGDVAWQECRVPWETS